MHGGIAGRKRVIVYNDSEIESLYVLIWSFVDPHSGPEEEERPERFFSVVVLLVELQGVDSGTTSGHEPVEAVGVGSEIRRERRQRDRTETHHQNEIIHRGQRAEVSGLLSLSSK